MNDNYISPKLEVLEVVVEYGYGVSGGNDNGGMNAPGWGGI